MEGNGKEITLNIDGIEVNAREGTSIFDVSKTIDIAQDLGEKKDKQLLVGFALENENEIENAKAKLKKKNLDLIVLNSLNDKSSGFKHDTNKITIIEADNKVKDFELKSKTEAAKDIINEIVSSIA